MSGLRTRTRVTVSSSRIGDHGVLVDHGARPRMTVPSARVTSLEQHPAEEPGLDVAALAGGVGARRPRARGRGPGWPSRSQSSIVDDQLLGDVDEPAGEVAGVGGAQGGVDEALAGARRGDEVLEHRQALAEVRLDRPGDHVASGVGHEAAHAGDLADLHHVPSGAGADHHVDGVERLGLEELLHRLAHLLGGLGPDLHFLLAPLTVGDDALAEVAPPASRPASRARRGSPSSPAAS